MIKTIKKTVLVMLAAFAAFMLTAAPISAFAVDPDKIVTDISMYSANLFLSDWEYGGVVLKNVTPYIADENTNALAAELEYNEVTAFDGNIVDGSSGAVLDLESLAWYLDMDVRITAARHTSGDIRIKSIITLN